MPDRFRTAEADEVLRIAGLVWPHEEPQLVDRAAPSNGRGCYAVIPSLAKPRLLAPVDHVTAGAVAMLESNDALTVRQRLSRAAGWAALRLGAGRLSRTRVLVSQQDSLQHYLAEVLGDDVAMVIGIGTPRANRKPVVRLTSPDGTVRGFAKVGVTGLTNTLVAREHNALHEVNERQWRLLRPPVVLHYGRWRDHNVLVLAPVQTPFRMRPPQPLTAPAAEAVELAHAWGVDERQLGDSPFLKRLTEQAAALPPGTGGDELTAGLAGLADRHGGELLMFGAWHGDFTPWNMTHAHGRLSLWDWEQFGHDVPVGADRIHFEVNVRTHREGMTEAAVTAGLRAGTDLPPWAAATLQQAYLAAIATRYTLAEQEEGGSAVAGAASLMRRLLAAGGGRS